MHDYDQSFRFTFDGHSGDTSILKLNRFNQFFFFYKTKEEQEKINFRCHFIVHVSLHVQLRCLLYFTSHLPTVWRMLQRRLMLCRRQVQCTKHFCDLSYSYFFVLKNMSGWNKNKMKKNGSWSRKYRYEKKKACAVSGKELGDAERCVLHGWWIVLLDTSQQLFWVARRVVTATESRWAVFVTIYPLSLPFSKILSIFTLKILIDMSSDLEASIRVLFLNT